MDEKKIEELVKRAVLADLDGVEFLQGFDYATLCREYNGIGPEWLPGALREKVTKYLALFEPAALIHDMRYAKADGSQLAWHRANEEFRANCRRLAVDAYPWWNWRRYRACAVAEALFDCVATVGGLAAYMNACKGEKNK